MSLLRKKKINDINLESIYEIEDKNNEINSIIDKVEFNKLISKLNDKEKEIISLKIISNLSFEEIGKLLNQPTGTVKWRYYKSIHTLKILLSNLGICIITFILGLKTLTSKKINGNTSMSQEITENRDQNEEQKKGQENIKDEDVKTETIEQKNSIKEENQINDIKEVIIIKENVEEHNFNYFGIGILTFSGIFLTFTIIFTIYLIKYQLKLNKKTSK